MLAARFHALGRNGPCRAHKIDLPPAGPAHLAAAGGGQDREMQRVGADSLLELQCRHECSRLRPGKRGRAPDLRNLRAGGQGQGEVTLPGDRDPPARQPRALAYSRTLSMRLRRRLAVFALVVQIGSMAARTWVVVTSDTGVSPRKGVPSSVSYSSARRRGCARGIARTSADAKGGGNPMKSGF